MSWLNALTRLMGLGSRAGRMRHQPQGRQHGSRADAPVSSAPSIPSVQTTHLGLLGIEDEVACFESGHYRAVLEVAGVNFRLRGECEQEALIAAYAALLNALTFPIQILVRARSVDLERYLQALERQAYREANDALVLLAREHVVFLRRLARNRSLLERRFYLVVPADRIAWPVGTRTAGGPAHAHSGNAASWWPFSPMSAAASLARRSHGGADTATEVSTVPPATLKQLTFRCDEIARQLGRAGLACRRLSTIELAELYYASWCPELARIQRLRGRLADYTALVVQGQHTTNGHQSAGSTAGAEWERLEGQEGSFTGNPLRG